jgi:predicted amidophosphoribosyltransferase
MMRHGPLSTCQSCTREVRPVRGICPNCGHLMDQRMASPPRRLSGGPSWWHDDLALTAAVLTVLGLVGGAVYAAFESGLVP